MVTLTPVRPARDSPLRSPAEHIAAVDRWAAHNYAPLPVVAHSAHGAWITGVDGRRYLDLLSAYSALNFGHGHPQLLAAAHEQLDRVTLVSRAFHHDRMAEFCARLARLCGKEVVLPMNTGAEAVESGIKVARRWGYDVRGVTPDRASITVASGNFHGRTTTIVGFSDDPSARRGFGPFAPGFRTVPYGDPTALVASLDADSVAVLLEPVQGEAGVVVPPPGYLRAVRQACDDAGVLLIADEIQSGLGRTGRTFACEHEGVEPDLYLLGKALGGGIVPVSAVVGDRAVLDVLEPGSHGSTFGGNPLACAVGGAVLDLLESGEPQAAARRLGARMRTALDLLLGSGVTEVRSLGLWAGVDIDPAYGTARQVCEDLLTRGVLAKDTHGATVRLAPPLVISDVDLDHALVQLAEVLAARAPSHP